MSIIPQGGGGFNFLAIKILCFFLSSSFIFAEQTSPNVIYIDTKNIKNSDDFEQAFVFLSQSKIFLNTVSLNTQNFKNINLQNVEFVEFIPNASKVLYAGGGSIINVISKKPSQEFLDFSLKGTSGEKQGLQGGNFNISGAKAINDKIFISGSLDADYTPFPRNTGLNEPFQFFTYTDKNPWTQGPYLRGWRQNCPKEPAFVDGVGKAWYYDCLEYRGAYKRGDFSQNLGANIQFQYEPSTDEWFDFNSFYNRTLLSSPAKRLNTITPRCIADATSPSGYTCSFYSSGQVYNHLTKDELKNQWRYTASDTINKFIMNDFQGFLNYEKQNNNLKFEALGYYHFNKVLYDFYDVSEGFDTKSLEGSELNQHTVGVNFKLKHDIALNTVIFGFDNTFEYANHKSKMNYSYDNNNLQTKLNTYSLMRGQKMSLSPYVYESLHLAQWFDLNGGFRLEYANYLITNEQSFKCSSTNTNGCLKAQYLKNPNFNHRFKRYTYALDLMPNFKYSNTGNIYIKSELGFISPSAFEFIDFKPDNEIKQAGNAEVTALFSNTYNNLQNQKYFKAELGWKDHFYSSKSLNVFVFLASTFTHTLNEVVSNQSSPITYIYRNLGDTQRVGVDFAFVQNFGALHLSQNLAYLYTNIINPHQFLDKLKGEQVPFVPNLRANFRVELDIFSNSKNNLAVFLNGSYTSEHNTLEMTEYKLSKANEGGYYLGDVGLNYIKKFKNDDEFVLLVGVKNILDRLYSVYAQADELSLAMGRVYFVEFKYSIK